MDDKIPAWLDVIVLPLMSLMIAFFVTGLIVLSIGANPFSVAQAMIEGAILRPSGLGYTLYYTTTYIFTGLAVAVAFHAAMFNIGGEGQAMVAGVGVAIAALALDSTHWVITLPVAMILSMAFGALWALLPAYLQAKRGSHIVITTIMMNFIASAIVGYIVIYVLRDNVAGANETRRFLEGAHIPRASDMLAWIGIEGYSKSVPMNITFFVALIAAVGVYYLIWRTRLGYEIRAFGLSNSAAQYAGISPVKIILIAMLISGALAGLMANNSVIGEQVKLGLNPVNGAGFIGIAVALMGRNHPVGIVLAAFLFGVLVQGGAELSFSYPEVSRDIVDVIKGLVILFVGALDNMVRIPIEHWWMTRQKAKMA